MVVRVTDDKITSAINDAVTISGVTTAVGDATPAMLNGRHRITAVNLNLNTYEIGRAHV